MKQVYKFKPASQSANPVGAVFHWNYITKEQYDVLCRFYSDSMIKIEEEEE